MTTVVQTSRFTKKIARLLSAQEATLLARELVDRPERGVVIQGTGGFRKHRFARDGGGRSGGLRIIYLYVVVRGVIFLVDAYAKNEKSDLTQREKKDLQTLARQLRNEA
ncbi:MAG TPA: type II toxin-antitoxin system RelE/ParE family toxin [Candidatus Kapabacteria bacterium]|nr:type II toxin-antitoxin system RelE/ParE family toxin [Candidatus Kapabacteria bacterium]